jgi:hypothetical protein
MLVLANRRTEAEPLLHEAIALFEAKGHTLGAEKATVALAALRAGSRSLRPTWTPEIESYPGDVRSPVAPPGPKLR